MAGEHPQAIALVLSYLPPQQAAALLAELTPEEQFSVVCRIATMGEASPEVVRDVENGLKRRSRRAVGRPTGNRGVAHVVRILNVMEPAAERRLLGKLAEADPQLVREIRRAMFGVDVAACEEWDDGRSGGLSAAVPCPRLRGMACGSPQAHASVVMAPPLVPAFPLPPSPFRC